MKAQALRHLDETNLPCGTGMWGGRGAGRADVQSSAS